ncbi:DUF2071 domain-containing protein [Cerasicoccus arenae]|uniref:DUF2071 domain-containing protein n=1 Tax=Cerasicoccus arenae TaxID=424488 RepID=A0A8J3DCR9_9BACT|nr:DUF2071 domain-containing protein [Cerasicoccus arenae]MBK1858472.1 DUF2071 domain-containing protein [Cerasicoccus arenae]GHC10443.1 hypothetical protein GCM10007047_29740 [Cerasicoccus arenae]
MNALTTTVAPHQLAVERLAEEGGPLLRAAWHDVLMMHFAIAAEDLQPHTPFPLDTFEGTAVVTLVAFHMEDLRVDAWPGAPHWLLGPAEHAFLNVRTYVRVGNELGIYFLAEYVPKLLARVAGPMTYGLPYQFTTIRYAHDTRNRRFGGRLGFRIGIEFDADYALAAETTDPGSFEEFVLERYNAYTRRLGQALRFRVEHPPWRMHRARLQYWHDAMLHADQPFWPNARYIGAHFTPGFDDVAMGAPQRITA